MVTQNILLLNEESLILLCFITFVKLTIHNLHLSITQSFKTQSLQIETLIKNSLKAILTNLQKFIIYKNSLKAILQKFIILKVYYINLGVLVSNFTPNYTNFFLTNAFHNRFNFIYKIEDQTIRLLGLVLLKRLIKISKTKKFYKFVIKISQFTCLETISLRECINSIDLKNK